MVEKTTSAGKLYNILIEAYGEDARKNSTSVWWKVLNAHAENITEVSKKLAELFTLFGCVRQDFFLLDENYRDFGLEALQRTQESIIYNGLRTNWDEVKKRIAKQDLSLIKMCDGLLISQGVFQNSLELEQAGELLEKVNNLIKEFHVSDLPNELRSELILELIKIQTALYEFEITGESQLQKTCNEVVGNIITKSSQYPLLYKKFVQPIQKIINTVVVIGGLMTTADLSIKYQPVLTTQIIKFLESLPDEPTAKQPLMEGATDSQEMEARIDDGVNHKVLIASGEEE